MGYDVWAKFDDPKSYGSGYVSAIEEALTTSGREQITLEDVQRRFKDYKNSEAARRSVPEEYFKDFVGYKNGKIDPFTASCDARELVKFETVFHDHGIECDGSGAECESKPKEVIDLYCLLWPQLFERYDRGEKIPEWDRYRHRFIKPRLFGEASGDVMNSFTQLFSALNKQNDQLAMLAYLTHTAGNLIPTPGTSRSPNQIHQSYLAAPDLVKDRWDLFLRDIQIWFKRNDGDYNEPYEGRSTNGISYMRFAEPEYRNFNLHLYNWLACFDSFEDFIVKNYLDDYYDFASHNVMVYDSDLEKRILQMNARIIARNIRMRREATERIANVKDGKYDIELIFNSIPRQDI